jgi:DsbC/DsbD-like thiol-disulfide interchange protein
MLWNMTDGSRIQIKMRKCLSRDLAFGIALLLGASDVQAQSTPIPHGTLELIAENQSIAPGHKFDVGLRFQLEKGWHIYWVNPGDSGEPPRVEWRLPAGLTAGAIEWPTPRRLESSSIVDYGYEDAVLLIMPIHAEAGLAALHTAMLSADVKLLICSHEMCIPGKAQLSLTLPVKSQPPVPDARNSDLFAATRKSFPHPAPGNWKFSVADRSDSFALTVHALRQRANRQITRAVFFPLTESQIENAAPQKFQSDAAGFRLTLRKSNQLLKPIERLQGVLVVSADKSDFDQSYLVDVPCSKSGAARSSHDLKIQAVGIYAARSLTLESLKEVPRI